MLVFIMVVIIKKISLKLGLPLNNNNNYFVLKSIIINCIYFFCLFSIFEIYKSCNKKKKIFFLSWGKRGDRQGDFRRAEAWRRSLRCCHEEDGHQDRRQGRRWASPLVSYYLCCAFSLIRLTPGGQ